MGKRRNIPQGIASDLDWIDEGPKNRGNDKEIEVEEERGNERCNEPTQWESPPQRQ